MPLKTSDILRNATTFGNENNLTNLIETQTFEAAKILSSNVPPSQ